MMNYMVGGAAMVKRHLVERYQIPQQTVDGDFTKLPPWTLGIYLLDFILFLPALIYVGYSLEHVYMTLALVEDPSPPAYEPLSSSDVDGTVPVAPLTSADIDAKNTPLAPTKPFTSSIRATNRLLRSFGGWRRNLAGLWCAFVLAVLRGLIQQLFGTFTHAWIGTLLASLALVQFSTVWVHLVISQRPAGSFWHRRPDFRRAFKATWLPVLANWAAETSVMAVLWGLAWAMNMPLWRPTQPVNVPDYHRDAAWKVVVLFVGVLFTTLAFVVPSRVALLRVQASLLPADENTVVPFDHSFQGTVEPAIVGGKGYVSMKDALRTFSRASWIRVFKLYAKICVVSFAVYFALFAILIAEIIFVKTSMDLDDDKKGL